MLDCPEGGEVAEGFRFERNTQQLCVLIICLVDFVSSLLQGHLETQIPTGIMASGSRPLSYLPTLP